MKKNNYLKSFILLLYLCFFFKAPAQQGKVKGIVQDAEGVLIGASVFEPITSKGTVTDVNGNYILSLDTGSYNLQARYVGYLAQTITVTVQSDQTEIVNFTLKEDLLHEVIILGSRAPNRTKTDSPVPVDVIDIGNLSTNAPQTNLNQLLTYTAPSFSSNTQTISDGTDHIDPASLRGLGPDQVLVLINGKRRHTSSLVNINSTFGRGNVGTDLNAIPAEAIENIEILRDGAAAQYGSDAIAGVINLRLKNDVNKLRFSVNTGANFTKNAGPEKEIDGEIVEVGTNYGIPLGKKGGVLNLTGAFNYRGWTNRMQEYRGQIFNAYNSIERVANNSGADIGNLSMTDVQRYAQQISHFSNEFKSSIASAPDLNSLRSLLSEDFTEDELLARGQERKDYNLRVGQSALRGGKFFANFSMPNGEDGEIYAFGGLSYRNGESGCFYRLPYQERTHTSTYMNGFLPMINSQISDQSLAVGIRDRLNEWNIDFSNTYGKNQFLFYMTQTHNATMLNASPVEFDAGGHSFIQNTADVNLSRYFRLNGIKGVNIAFGAEYRYENFNIIRGSEVSYGNYDINLNLVNSTTPENLLVTDFFGVSRPAGAQCFIGFLPANEIAAKRSSIGGYLDAEIDFSDDFLVGAAIRFENYSDFGSTFNYKLVTRYKISDQFIIRAGHSTGFRAPSLHQIHFSRTTTVFNVVNGVSVPQEVGIFSNGSMAAELLGIPQLKQETSQDFSAGFTIKLPNESLLITIDGYLINIDDRIILTGQFKKPTAKNPDPELTKIFDRAQADAAAFFANAIDTRSIGLDVVIGYNLSLGNILLTNNLASTFYKNEQVGEIKASDLLIRKGLVNTYFDDNSRRYLEKAVPRTKITLSNNLNFNKFNIYIRNTYFGSTEKFLIPLQTIILVLILVIQVK